MTRPVVIRALTRHDVASTTVDQDLIAVEAPISLVVLRDDGTRRALGLLMRTPGDDEDLAVGVLVTEGVIRNMAEVTAVQATSDELLVTVTTIADLDAISDRVGAATSACGLCGRLALRGVDALAHRRPAAAAFDVAPAVIRSLPETLRAHQSAFAHTGGLHAAGVFALDGSLRDLREDVGRHNAVDKIAGALARRGALPATNLILVVSGRVAYEIVQKAVMCGLPMIVAVGAPTDLAVDAARATGLTLVGFARDGRFNVYAGGERIQPVS